MADNEGGRRPSLILGTIKAAAVVAFLSYCASSWLAGPGFDQQSLSRMAAATARGDDPVTTGSIGRAANASRLDPCGLPNPGGKGR